MRLALAQINAVVGDLDGNRERILAALTEARDESADIVLLPELAVTGYPPEDLLLRPGFVRAAEESLRAIAAETKGLTALVGTPWFDRRPLQRLRRLLGRRAAGALPQALSPQLRRLRRGALLRLGPGADPAPARRDPRRPDDLRGHLAARAARHRSRARRRRADRQPLRLAVLRRQGRGPRGDARHAGARQLGLSRFLQPRRRPGRAALRRALGRARRRGRGARTRPGFEEALLVVDLDPSEAIGRRLRDVRRRALAREREDEREPEIVELVSGSAST